ncbi:MAG: hypothetical protein HC923_03395, partial [Myxococcales bacterium]|nr:hypothetical protein [Myxococcales bacterium]
MSTPQSRDEAVSGLQSLVSRFVQFAFQERTFLGLLGASFLLVGMTFEDAAIARWVGFAFAGYAATANDSIQTIGTFLSSNQHRPWWMLWIYIAGLFVV